MKRNKSGQFAGHVSNVEIKRVVGNALEVVVDEDELEGLSFKEKRKRLALAMNANGHSQQDIAELLGVNQQTVSRILSTATIDEKEGRKFLKKQLLTNAALSGFVFGSKAQEMTAAQAAMASGVFTKSFIALDAATPKQEEEYPIEEILAIGEDLRELKDAVKQNDHTHP